MEDADVAELFGEPVGQLAGAVGRVVVDDEHVDAFAAESAQHRLEVLAFVVRGETDDGFRHVRIFNGWLRPCLATSTWRTSSTCSPTCWRSRARPRFGCWPTARPRRASARLREAS